MPSNYCFQTLSLWTVASPSLGIEGGPAPMSKASDFSSGAGNPKVLRLLSISMMHSVASMYTSIWVFE